MRLWKKIFQPGKYIQFERTFQYGDDRGDLFFHGSDE